MFRSARRCAAAACLWSLLHPSGPVFAQDNAVPPELAAQIAAIGRVIDPGKSVALYAALQEQAPYADVKIQRDVSYGPDGRQLLDIFATDTAGAPRAVLVFVHGGGFVGGNKRIANSPFYDNVALWAVRSGMVGVNMTYRLAPAASWPAGAEDVGLAIEWVLKNIAAHGGDRARVYLMGSSAGATHVADYLARGARQKGSAPRVAGAILLSGIYDLETFELPAQYQLYFGKDRQLYAERSSLSGLLQSSVPLLVSQAEHDPLSFEGQARQLREALCKSVRGCQTSVVLSKHNHLTQTLAVNTRDTTLTGQILKFIKPL